MASTLSRPHPAFPRKHPAARPTRHTGESRKPRRPPTSGQWLVDSGQPQPPGTWAPAFAPPSFRRKPETTRPQTLRDVDPRFRPPPPRLSGENRKPRRPPTPRDVDPGFRRGDGWGAPGRRGWVAHPAFAPPHSGESRKPRRPPTLRDVDPGPQPPVIPAKAGNHAAPQPSGTWTPAPNPPSFRRKPETTPPPNPQGRGPRLSPGRRVGGAWETGLGRPPGFRPPVIPAFAGIHAPPYQWTVVSGQWLAPTPRDVDPGFRPPTRHSGGSRKPRDQWTVVSGQPHPPGTWTPAFAGETGLVARDVDPGFRRGDGVGPALPVFPAPPVFPAKAGNHALA